MSVATFTVPSFGGDQAWQYAYAAVTLSLLGMLYSIVTIPYGSLATVMTKDPVERARLGVWRMLGPVVTMLGLAVIISPQISRHTAAPEGCSRSSRGSHCCSRWWASCSTGSASPVPTRM